MGVGGEYDLTKNGNYGPFGHLGSDQGKELGGFITDDRYSMVTGGSTEGPHRIDSFILISAGPDQLYGTMDDVANFNVGPEN